MAASFRCYDNSDVIAFLIMTNFHLYLIKLWWQFFQMFVYGDVVMLRIGRYWPWKLLRYRTTFICQYGLCCCIVWPSFPVDFTFRKNLGNLREFFGQMVYRPPWQKISRTPMRRGDYSPTITILFSIFIDVNTLLMVKLEDSRLCWTHFIYHCIPIFFPFYCLWLKSVGLRLQWICFVF